MNPPIQELPRTLWRAIIVHVVLMAAVAAAMIIVPRSMVEVAPSLEQR